MDPAQQNFGGRLLPDLFFVSWGGMTPGQIDCHVFVLRSPAGLLLIDCGTPWGHERILRNMAHRGLPIADVRTILLTHGHVDHVAGGYRFKERGIEILGHRDILTLVECQWEATGALAPNGQGHRMDGYLSDGDTISRCGFDIRVIATPGHTRGCLSFLIEINGQRCLFSGDLVMGNALPGWNGDPGFSADDAVASLKRLQREEFQHLCFGHGVIMDDGGKLFRESLAKEAEGEWDRRGVRMQTGIQGRAPAAEKL